MLSMLKGRPSDKTLSDSSNLNKPDVTLYYIQSVEITMKRKDNSERRSKDYRRKLILCREVAEEASLHMKLETSFLQ